MASNSIPPLSSYSTALVLLPPPHIQSLINPIRSANDKSFPRWTSHLTLVFPFVEPSHLPAASSLIRDALSKTKLLSFTFQLDEVGMFKQREYDTVFLGTSNATDVHRVWNVVSSAVGYKGRPFVPHLTLGQAHRRENSLTFLHDKGKQLLNTAIQWELGSVVVLRKSEDEGGLMKIYDEIPLSLDYIPSPRATVAGLRPAAYHLQSDNWIPSAPVIPLQPPKALTLATYNVLFDSHHPTTTRLPHILSVLLQVQPVPDIVCLQEVTDEFLSSLLADPLVQDRWSWCTHNPTSVLPGQRNIVFLSREPFGFVWEYVHLRGKHKPAVVLQLPGSLGHAQMSSMAQPLVITGVHLTAGLTSSDRRKKLEELERLYIFLCEHHSASQWIVMGDTNIPTSQPVPQAIEDMFYDAWLTARGSKDGGGTYDPESNTLAAETVREDRSTQRYDRILVRRDMGMRVQAVDMFGQYAGEASDHYGVAATIDFSDSIDGDLEEHQLTTGSGLHPKARDVVEETTVATDPELEASVREKGGFPTETQKAERARVVAAIRMVLSPGVRSAVQADSEAASTSDANKQTPAVAQPQSAVRFKVVPVGSFGLGVDTQNSDIDILVVGNIPPRTFWALTRARLRKLTPSSRVPEPGAAAEESTPSVILKRFIKDASVPMMELLVGNISVDMQYCSAGKILESWDQVPILPLTDPLFLLPAPSLRTLNAYRDMLHILHILPAPSLSVFRLTHRTLKLFCVAQGIYSSRLGYLGGIHITLLLTRVTLLSSPIASASQLLSAFFAMYAEWDWAHQAATIPGVGDNTTYARSPGREPMVILSIQRPTINVVQNANKHTTSAITSVFKRAHSRLMGGSPWPDVCGSGGICGVEFEEGFLRAHASYIKLDLSFWGSSISKVRLWIRFVESRLPQFLIQLQTALPNWSVRLWPTRLVDGSSPGDLSTGLQSFYLLGFDAPTNPTSGKKIQSALFSFEDQLRRYEHFYDATEMFVSVSQVEASQLPEKINTPAAWSDGGIDPDDGTSDEEEDIESSDNEGDPDAAFAPMSAKQIKQRRLQQSRSSSALHIPGAKLRTSSDVYNRLVWDRELKNEEYLIGYEDRFAGLKEMPLASWKREVEDEAFVPFHRVVHFRRKSDGVLIWDRRKRIDLVFGSGVRLGPSESF